VVISRIKSEGKLNNVVVGGLTLAGAIAFGISCYGRQVELVEYCFKPNDEPQFCTPNKRYLMPADEFSRILNDPLTPEDRIIGENATRLRILPPTNPHKWLWGLVSVGFLSTAYGLSKARERKLIEYLPTYREGVKQSWLHVKIDNWQRERRAALEAFNDDRKRQYAADLDYQLYQFGADRAARAKQLSMLTPEEIAIFHEQARLRATLEAQAQIIEATGQPQAALTGQSLDEINDPSDKVEGENVEEIAPTNASSDQFSEYRRIGQSIIKSMIVSDKSVLIASGTGTGKTTTEQYYLRQFVSRYPQSEIYALLNKNDDLYGVRRERRLVFAPEALMEMPNAKEERAALLRQLLTPLYSVYDIFLIRKQKPETERKRLKVSHPIRLILGDWYGTYQELLARLTKDELQGVLSMIRQMITIGRDMGIGLIVDTQSANLESLGLAGDASIRLSLDIFSQGFIYYQEDEEKGELQTIRLVFGNKSICSPEDREAIATTFNFLANAIKDGKLKTPIVFTSVGSRPRLGIVPELSDDVSSQTNVDWNDVARQLDATYLRSEFMVSPQVEREPEEINEVPLTEKHNAILNYLKANGARTLKQIADSRRLGLPETRELLKDLVSRELVELDGDVYRLTTT
jgi:hypothetical protein